MSGRWRDAIREASRAQLLAGVDAVLDFLDGNDKAARKVDPHHRTSAVTTQQVRKVLVDATVGVDSWLAQPKTGEDVVVYVTVRTATTRVATSRRGHVFVGQRTTDIVRDCLVSASADAIASLIEGAAE